MKMKFPKIVLASVLVLTLAACGSGDESAKEKVSNENETVQTEVVEAGPIVLIDDLGNKIEFKEAPKSVATLNPGMLDILVELGTNVTGRPSMTTEMTDEVKAIQEIGNPHEPSFEQIAAVNPELLIVPPSFMQYAATLEATGTKVAYLNMESIDGIKETIEKYGELFAKEDRAKELVQEIDAKLAEAKEESTLNALIVYGAPGTYLAALDNSLYGDILAKVGGKNIASDLPALDKYPSFASLSAEKIVEGNPQIIMLITHANPEVVQAGFEKQMSEDAAWKNLDAVKNNQILILPSELFDNPGTQVVEAIDYMKNLLKEAEAAAAK
jgi:iron complex transport system substrate-binding protein